MSTHRVCYIFVSKQSTVWRESIESQQFSTAGQFVKSLLLIYNSMNLLEIHCGHCGVQGQKKISVATTFGVIIPVFCRFVYCVDYRGSESPPKAMLSKEGIHGPWLAFAALDYSFRWLDVPLEMFTLTERATCLPQNKGEEWLPQHAIWDSPSSWWQYSTAICVTWSTKGEADLQTNRIVDVCAVALNGQSSEGDCAEISGHLSSWHHTYWCMTANQHAHTFNT